MTGELSLMKYTLSPLSMLANMIGLLRASFFFSLVFTDTDITLNRQARTQGSTYVYNKIVRIPAYESQQI